MALTITYNQVDGLTIRISKTTGAPNADMGVAYIITQNGSFPIQRAKADIALTSTQQNQINNLYAAVLNVVKTIEGIA
jgi:hypothetical protein